MFKTYKPKINDLQQQDSLYDDVGDNLDGVHIPPFSERGIPGYQMFSSMLKP